MAKEDNAINACNAPLLELQIQIAAVWYDRKKLQAENERLREYARHKKDCHIGCRIILSEQKEGCTCGFEQALKV